MYIYVLQFSTSIYIHLFFPQKFHNSEYGHNKLEQTNPNVWRFSKDFQSHTSFLKIRREHKNAY